MDSNEIYNVFSENSLTCHICLEEYKDPRVLPCYHTFCLKCIADHVAKNGVQNKFSCPLCRQETPVPPGGLKTLVKNFFFRKVTYQKAPGRKLCEHCKHNEATLLCKGCPNNSQLCTACRESHEKMSSCVGHSFLPLLQGAFSREEIHRAFDEDQYCDKHDGELLTFYCEEDDTVACRDCILESHSKHNFKKLGDVVKVQRDLIQEKLKCLPTEKLSRFQKAENAILQTEERLTDKQTNVLHLVDSQNLVMTKEINKNRKTIDMELNAYYQKVEKDVRQQTDAYLASVKQSLETYRKEKQSNYTEMKKNVDDKSNKIKEEIKALTSTQVKTLEAERDKQEMKKISIQSIRDFAQQLTVAGSDIEVITHSKKLQTRIQELQKFEPGFYTEIADITFTPGQTEMDVQLQFPKIPEPRPLSIKTGSITAKTYRGTLDSCFGSLKKAIANPIELQQFQKVTWLETVKLNIQFNITGNVRDIQCTDAGFILVVRGYEGYFELLYCKYFNTVSVFSSTGQCKRDISIEGRAKCITTVSNDRFVVTCEDKCCRLYSTSGQVIRCFGQGDMSDPWGVTVDHTEGRVYVCDSGAQCICVYDMKSFQLVNRIPIPMCSKGALFCAYHPGINAIIVSDCSAHCVYAVTPHSGLMFQYGARGQSGSEDGHLSYPQGVCVDKFGHIFIADYSNHRVLVLGSNGIFLRNISTLFKSPVSVDINSKGELVVRTKYVIHYILIETLSTYRYINEN